MSASGAAATVGRGHVLLAVCCALYLAWWVLFFRPGSHIEGPLYWFGVALILGAATCGIIGCFSAGGALSQLPGAQAFSPVPYLVAGVVAYLVLAFVTNGFLDRPITTELVLIVAWCAFECAVVGALSAATVSQQRAVMLYVLVGALVVASLVCYVLYYRLDSWPAFYDGMVPLVSVGIAAVIVATSV